jgi:hypothetical protein
MAEEPDGGNLLVRIWWIVAAVGTSTEVLLDGGIRRASSVAKALCLGARAVLIGRPFLYGLACTGQPGAFRPELLGHRPYRRLARPRRVRDRPRLPDIGSVEIAASGAPAIVVALAEHEEVHQDQVGDEEHQRGRPLRADHAVRVA